MLKSRFTPSPEPVLIFKKVSSPPGSGVSGFQSWMFSVQAGIIFKNPPQSNVSILQQCLYLIEDFRGTPVIHLEPHISLGPASTLVLLNEPPPENVVPLAGSWDKTVCLGRWGFLYGNSF